MLECVFSYRMFSDVILVPSKRGSSLYGQPSWWTPPDEDAPLTLQPIHSAVKWTEASPTPVKSGRSSTPADSKKRYSTPITKATGVSPRERSSSTKESKLTTRLMKKITPSAKKVSSSEEKTSTTSSSTTSSASTSSTDFKKGAGEKITRGTPRRQTYVKKTSSRPATTETASTTTHSTPLKGVQSTQKGAQSTPQKTTQSTLQKPDTKFDRKSPQRHTYNKKKSTAAANQVKDETPNTPKIAQKRPRETISELRQRMQQAKKAAQEANKDGESDIQIFVSSSTPHLDQDEDQVIDDEGSNEVTSSSASPIDLSSQSGSHRKQWGTKDVCISTL